MLCLAVFVRKLAYAVLDHDDGTIHNQSKINRAQAHEASCYARVKHHVGSKQHRQWNCQRDNDPRSQVAEHQ